MCPELYLIMFKVCLLESIESQLRSTAGKAFVCCNAHCKNLICVEA